MIRFELVLIILFINIYSQQATAKQLLNLVGNNDNYPACYTNINGEVAGIDVDIIREMAIRVGIDVRITLVPWVRTLEMIERGTADGGFPLFKTEERKEFAFYTQIPLHVTVMQAYARNSNNYKSSNLTEMKSKRIGINRGYFISSEFDIAAKNGFFDLIEVDNVQQLTNMLLKGRLDIAVAKRSTMGAHLKYSGEVLATLGMVNKEQDAFLVLSKKSKIENKLKILQDINIALKEMKLDGTIERITMNYID